MNENEDESLSDDSRTHAMYRLMLEELVIGQNSIADELQKPAGEQNVHYMMGQTEINVALQHAINVLENSGLIDETMLLCHCCAELITGHEDDEDSEAVESDVTQKSN